VTTVLILAAIWLLLLVWILGLPEGCRHERLTGVANYYDHDLHCFIHLKQCEDCNEAIITHER
jgi:hypothetical protein